MTIYDLLRTLAKNCPWAYKELGDDALALIDHLEDQNAFGSTAASTATSEREAQK